MKAMVRGMIEINGNPTVAYPERVIPSGCSSAATRAADPASASARVLTPHEVYVKGHKVNPPPTLLKFPLAFRPLLPFNDAHSKCLLAYESGRSSIHPIYARTKAFRVLFQKQRAKTARITLG